MATTTITALTAVLAGNLDDTAVVPVDDKNLNTRKATIAQLRTAIAAAAIAFLSTVSVAGTAAFTGGGITVSSAAGTASVTVTATTAGQQANVSFFDAATLKWQIGKIGGGTNDFFIFNNGSGNNSIRIQFANDNVALAGSISGPGFAFAASGGGISSAFGVGTAVIQTNDGTGSSFFGVSGGVVCMGATNAAYNTQIFAGNSPAVTFDKTTLRATFANNLTTLGGTVLTTSSALTNNAGASAGTLTNAPAIGNPTKWFPINDNGTVRNIPAW